MANLVGIVIEILFFLTNMNLLVSHADIIKTNESMNSVKYNEKKNFINRLKYAEVKIFSICADVYQSYEGDDYDKIYEVSSTIKKVRDKQFVN